jgi:hypothetical protein
MTTILRTSDFVWRGLSLHLGRSPKPTLALVPDAHHPNLYRIRYPSGWTSTPANLTRAKDAAYGHARYLLAQDTAGKGPYSPEGREAA